MALFRATAGIWPTGVGTLAILPPLAEIFFLPQRPYLPPRTLRDLLLTGQEQVMTDDEITAALREAGLDSRAGACWPKGSDSEHDWPTMLSVAEQQLLALCG